MPRKKRKQETVAKEEEPAVLERGHVYFFYRPKVETEEAHEMGDVQRLYLILAPGTLEQRVIEEAKVEPKKEKELYRIVVMGQKKLPDPYKG